MTTSESAPVRVPRNFEQTTWMFMRYSAVFLVPLAFGHIVLQDVIVGVHRIDLDYATQRMAMLGWKIYDLFLLGFAFAHGMNGLRQVLHDAISSPKLFRLVSVLLLIVWAVITAIGAIALFAIRPAA